MLAVGIRASPQAGTNRCFCPFIGEEIEPGEGVQDEAGYTSISATVPIRCSTVGSCQMGINSEAVVNSRLEVNGVEGLRIADASIMPSIVNGNTNAPTIMIAEKAADMIKSAG